MSDRATLKEALLGLGRGYIDGHTPLVAILRASRLALDKWPSNHDVQRIRQAALDVKRGVCGAGELKQVIVACV